MTGVTRVTRVSGSGSGDEAERGGYRLSRSVNCHARLVRAPVSRMADEIILWSNQQFSFINLPDELATGSSIMPQKKNPDGAELVRGKASSIISNLNGLLVILKGLPLAYSKDLQDDKKIVFSAFDDVCLTIEVMTKGAFNMNIKSIIKRL